MNFEKYNDKRPSPDIIRKIGNFFIEYSNNYDKEYAKESFIEICSNNNLTHFIFLGYLLNNAYSQDQKGWEEMFSLIIDYLFKQEKLFTEKDLLEG